MAIEAFVERLLLVMVVAPLVLIAVYFMAKAFRMGWLRANELHRKRRK